MCETVVEFVTRFPEFSEIDDPRIQMFMSDATLQMGSESRWLNFYSPAHCYLTAHLLSVAISSSSGDNGAVFPIKKQEVDDVLIEQAVGEVSPTLDSLYSTIYGKQYLRYLRLAFTGPIGV